MEKLNLKWVSKTIGEEYKQWRKGDIVTIQAQTGTGKTYFIKNKLVSSMDLHEHMLILANRINLKRQLKKDLLKNMKKDMPLSNEELDKMYEFGNVTIMSYQQINQIKHRETYDDKKLNLDFYDYIICDECHFIMSDGGFNNKCDYSILSLIKNNIRAIKVFISATMEEVKNIIVGSLNNKAFGILPKHYDYTTGIDYSYIDAKYFKNIKDMAVIIKNSPKENGKWLIFVTKKIDGITIKEIIGNLKTVSIITKETKNNEDLNNILENSKFNSDVLICTKALDNGINISDCEVKNIVIMSFDKITFLQELGRIRQDINNTYKVNLYIQTKSKKSFTTLISKIYEPKFKLINEYCGANDDGLLPKKYTDEEKEKIYKEFCIKYNRDFDKLPKDIFYIDKLGKWKINIIGYARLIKDNKFANHMVDLFKKDYKFAFIKEQLSWINLENTFNENNLMENVMDNEDLNNIEIYLQSLVGVRLHKEARNELIDKLNLTDSRGRQQKKITTLAGYVLDNFNMILISKKVKEKGKLVTIWLLNNVE